MQTLSISSTNQSASLTIPDPEPLLEFDQSLEEAIHPSTLIILAAIAAERDYYESGGRW